MCGRACVRPILYIDCESLTIQFLCFKWTDSFRFECVRVFTCFLSCLALVEVSRSANNVPDHLNRLEPLRILGMLP